MHKEKDFTTTLISSGCMNVFPNNTKANFYNYLIDRRNLDEQYEVALTSAILPDILTIEDIKEGGFILIRTRNENNVELIEQYDQKVTIEQLIDRSEGKTPEENLLKIIHFTLTRKLPVYHDYNKWVNLRYYSDSYSMNIGYTKNYKDGGLGIKFYGNLSNIFGFKDHLIYGHTNTTNRSSGEPTRHVSINDLEKITHNNRIIMIYSNIITTQEVGGSKLQLLSIFPHQRTIHFNPPKYIPLNTRYLDTIQITIKDDTGELILFTSDTKKTILDLHFRPIKNAKF